MLASGSPGNPSAVDAFPLPTCFLKRALRFENQTFNKAQIMRLQWNTAELNLYPGFGQAGLLGELFPCVHVGILCPAEGPLERF